MLITRLPQKASPVDVLAEPVDLHDDGHCSVSNLKEILDEFRSKHPVFRSESDEELLEYYNLYRDEKGLGPIAVTPPLK